MVQVPCPLLVGCRRCGHSMRTEPWNTVYFKDSQFQIRWMDDVTMLEHIFINLNLCCIQWYKFRVCRGEGSRDTVTNLPMCTKIIKNGLFTGSQLHIYGDVTILLHTVINFNLYCIQRFKSHVDRWYGSGDTTGQSYPCAPKPQNMVNL